MRNPFGNISAPPHGYIWDYAKRAGVSVRSYGEFAVVARTPRRRGASPTVPGLEGPRPSRRIRRSTSTITDNKRVDIWLEEFREFEQRTATCRSSRSSGSATITPAARRPARRRRARWSPTTTSRSGALVEAISHSRYLEGVGDLRPRGRRAERAGSRGRAPLGAAVRSARSRAGGVVDSTLYTTSGVLRTMELILGLPPMSQYDAAATPMYNAFQTDSDARAVHAPCRRASRSTRRTTGRRRAPRRRCG